MRVLFIFLTFAFSINSLNSQTIIQNKKKMFGIIDSLGRELIRLNLLKLKNPLFLLINTMRKIQTPIKLIYYIQLFKVNEKDYIV